MSSQNGYPGPTGGRPAARPASAPAARQPTWVNPQAAGLSNNGVSGWPQQPTGAGYQTPATPPQGPQSTPSYGQWNDVQPSFGGQPAAPLLGAPPADPYAPQFEPYIPPQRASYPQSPMQTQAPRSHPSQPAAPQWSGRPESRGPDAGGAYAASYAAPQAMPQQSYGTGFAEQSYQEPELSAADWAGPQGNYAQDPYYQQQAGSEFGFGQPEGGELEPAYGEEEMEYEEEDDAPRGRRPLTIALALIGAILVGGSMAYGYKKFASGSDQQGDPPVIKSAEYPSKTKPADAGGKQFPYSDTKILGRLGDGSSTAESDQQEGGGSTASSSDTATGQSGSVDENGTRKVSTLVVGRDGTIQPPPTPAADTSSSSDTGVPGTALVDVFGQRSGSAPPPPRSQASDAPAKPKVDMLADAPMPSKKSPTPPIAIAKVNGASKTTTGSIDDNADAPVPPPKKKLKKVAKAETTETDADTDAASGPPVASVATSASTSGGYVAVLASVPKSASSRMDALKRFADMQQKYGDVLAGKTPDVASANLGAKGNYDRLIVGPAGSRETASNVCLQLKAQGYTNCWVTSY